MPRLAPVTIATRPESPRSMGLCLVDRSHGANRINDRNQNLGPHPEEAALFARPSRRMATGTIPPGAVPLNAGQGGAPRTRAEGIYRRESDPGKRCTRACLHPVN